MEQRALLAEQKFAALTEKFRDLYAASHEAATKLEDQKQKGEEKEKEVLDHAY